jgi:hypothetical protein
MLRTQQVWRFHLLLNSMIQKPPDRRSGDGAASLIPRTGIKFLSRYKQLLFQPDGYIDHPDLHLQPGLADELIALVQLARVAGWQPWRGNAASTNQKKR